MTNTPTPPKQGVRARERNAVERLAGLEQDVQRLVGAVQQAFNDNEQKLRDLAEIVDVIVADYGRDTIQLALHKARVARAEEEAQKAKEGLDIALLEGKVEKDEAINPESIITGFEKNKDGETIAPGYVQLSLSTVKPQFAEKMIGQGVGFVFETDGGGSFEVTGVFKVIPQGAPDEAPAVDPVAAAVDVTPAA
jgi:hypothetical protein